jgi:glycosidase
VPRLRTVLGGDLAAVRLASLLQLTLPGAPSIYYGDELGLEGHQDPDNRGAYPVGAPTGEAAELRAFVKALIGLRHGHRALRDGAQRTLAAVGGTIVLLRSHGQDDLVIAANAGDEPVALTVDLPATDTTPALVDLPGWAPGPERSVTWEDPGRLRLAVPARSGLVARLVRRSV